MFNNVALDVAIGLIFIFLLYSLLAATLHEAISSVFAYRPRMLERALEQMLDGKNYAYNWWDAVANWFLWLFNYKKINEENKRTDEEEIKKVNNASFFKKGTQKTTVRRVKLNKKAELFAARITDHPLYKRAADSSTWSITRKPSYLGAAAFTDIFIDVLRKESEEQGTKAEEGPLLLQNISATISSPAFEGSEELKRILRLYIEQSNGNLEQFRRHIEDWYDFMMERVTGWYKRQTSRILFTLGLVLAISFNVDTIDIVHKLSTNRELSKAWADYAAASAKEIENVNSSDTAFKKRVLEIFKEKNITIDSANKIMGLGWGDLSGKTCCQKFCYIFCKTTKPSKLTGFLITAFAISLGALFWFDLLNKLVRLRGAGTRPEQAAAQATKTTAKVPGKDKPLQGSKA